MAEPEIFNPDKVVVPNPVAETVNCDADVDPTMKPYVSPTTGETERRAIGVVEEMPTLPMLSTVNNVAVVEALVVEAIEKSGMTGVVEEFWMERKAKGDDVSKTVLPTEWIIKLVAVEDPTTKYGTPEPKLFGLSENNPHGDVVPIPMKPEFC